MICRSEHANSLICILMENKMLSQVFTYEPLLKEDRIRILSLCPAYDSRAPIRAVIYAIDLDGPIAYEAISYSWSDREDGLIEYCKTITCNGQALIVTKTAFDALHRFRLPDRERHLWIDAICIDQGNIKERMQQVSIMARIYSTATKTLVWLGNDSPSHRTYDAITCFKGLASDTKQWVTFYPSDYPSDAARFQAMLLWCWFQGRWEEGGGSGEHPHAFTKNSERPVKDGYFYDAEGKPGLDRGGSLQCRDVQLLPCLIALLRRRWFSRRWILQEMRHCRQAVLCCAEWSIGRKPLCQGLYVLRDNLLSFDSVCSLEILIPLDRARRVLRLQGSYNGPRSQVQRGELSELLLGYEAFDCSDDRDKVFAFLSFSDVLILQPDYSLSVEAVYFNFARASINNGGVQSLLWQAAIRQPRPKGQSRESLPTWVPDFRVVSNLKEEGVTGLMPGSDGWSGEKGLLGGMHPNTYSITHLLIENEKLLVLAWAAGFLVAPLSPESTATSAKGHSANPQVKICSLYLEPNCSPNCNTPMQLGAMFGDLRAGDILLAVNASNVDLIYTYMVVRRKAPRVDEFEVVGWCELAYLEADRLYDSLQSGSLLQARNVVLV